VPWKPDPGLCLIVACLLIAVVIWCVVAYE